jgi:hypothetical protein
MNIAAILTASMSMHPREAVQHLTQAVLQQTARRLRFALAEVARETRFASQAIPLDKIAPWS